MKIKAVAPKQLLAALAPLMLATQAAHGIDIPDVQPAAWDQPQIYAALTRNGGPPLENVLLATTHFSAFLDTGASGLVLDPFYASSSGFNVAAHQCDGTDLVFSDVAVGGSVDYNVSESLELRLAGFQPYVQLYKPEAFDTEFNQGIGPTRLQLGPIGGLDLVNVIGMPAITGRVMVVDPKPLDNFLVDGNQIDQLHTYLYSPGTPFSPLTSYTEPGIPATDSHVQLTMVDASRFTRTVPGPETCPPPDPGSETAELAPNPFIGPNPLSTIDPGVPAGTTPGVTISMTGGVSATGSFLLDTGAALSFISTDMAAQVQVRYRTGTYGTDSPVLEAFDPNDPGTPGAELPEQFSFGVSGLGGAITVAGFKLDSLLVKTNEGDAADPNDPAHLRYLNVPVVVYDISLQDPSPAPGNGDTITLDGIFGMNLLVASVLLGDNPLVIEATDQRLAPFEWIVFDEPNATLGLKTGPSIDGDADNDGVRDFLDLCPLVNDPNQVDTDLDLAGDACDALPLDGTETLDTDGDETGNNADPDDDGDGTNDAFDVCPLTPDPGQEDNDGDGLGDACDPDDDDDGIEDPVDAFPDDGDEHTDTDGDGIGNNTDPDDDNDGLSDEYELANGLDPLDASDCPRWICPSGFSSGWRVILSK